MSYHKINSFREVVFTGRNVLILCDIDDTLLTFRKNTKPELTDANGFTDMVNRMSSTSKIVFLTARPGGKDAHYTKKDFESIGINYEDESVFYTNNVISKGEYIYRFIKTNQFDQVIFIDDLWENMMTVRLYCPKIDRYHFVYSTGPILPSNSTV
jgi:hypothetical protein